MGNGRTLAIAAVSLLVIGLLSSGLTGGMMGGYWNAGAMGPGWMWSGVPGQNMPTGLGWAGGLLMILGMLGLVAFWGAVLLGGVLLVRWAIAQSSAGQHPAAQDPIRILRRRYAAGEIDQATYDQMRQDLGESSNGSPSFR